MRYDLIVAANPVWELAWIVEAIPEHGIAREMPSHNLGITADGGGSALNSACALAAAGRRVLAVGNVGDDADGRSALEALQRRGVETAVTVHPGRTTKRNHLYVEASSHETAFQVIVPERVALPWEDEPPALREARVLLLDRLAARASSWLALRRGGPWVNFFSRNSALGTPATEERFRQALPLIDILQMPERPAGRTTLTEEPWPAQEGEIRSGPVERDKIHRPSLGRPMPEEEAERIMGAGVHTLLRTRGSEGLLLQVRTSSPGIRPCSLESWNVPARPTELVDPTGAGDALTAGYLDAFLDGLSPLRCAERGVDWAARACRHLGARGWLDHEPPSPAARIDPAP
jgi:sugar/nucleoside kinase (ribokinase family)